MSTSCSRVRIMLRDLRCVAYDNQKLCCKHFDLGYFIAMSFPELEENKYYPAYHMEFDFF